MDHVSVANMLNRHIVFRESICEGFAFVAQGKVTMHKHPELADLLRKQGGKTGAELKAEGK